MEITRAKSQNLNSSKKIIKDGLLILFLLFVISPIASIPCYAAYASDYKVRHNFKTRLSGNQVYRGAWGWHDRAIARSTGGAPGDELKQGVLPFDPPATNTETATAISGDAIAEANSRFSAKADGSGFSEVFGWAKYGATGTYLYSGAVSNVCLNRGVARRDGSIRWSPYWQVVSSSSGVLATGLGDPIDVISFDLDNNDKITSRLFDIELLFNGPGSSNYENGEVSISAREGKFSLTMDSPYITTGTGTIEIEFNSGFVTQSMGTGVFNGLNLPSVGSDSSMIAFHLGDTEGNFDIGFDFGYDPNNNNGYNLVFNYSTSAYIEAVPEPSTLSLLLTGCLASFFAFGCKRKRGCINPLVSS